jgi:Fe-S cluster assembly protein SufD
MSEAGALARPTTRDEAWRYADGAWLAQASEISLHHWATVEVPPGETKHSNSFQSSGPQASGGSVHRTRVHVGAGGRYEHFEINASHIEYTRIELEVTLEEGAHFEFGGVTIGRKDARQEFVTRVIHKSPNATSNQVVRAVQAGRSTANYLGRIEVARDAQKTDAAQNFRAILLNKGASANAKPELEIFADDVKCAHGAAIGQLDQAAAYYMAARGIAPDVARKLLVQAFIGDALAAIGDRRIADRMLERALEQLDGAAL